MDVDVPMESPLNKVECVIEKKHCSDALLMSYSIYWSSSNNRYTTIRAPFNYPAAEEAKNG